MRLLIAEDYYVMRERIKDFLASEHDVLGAFEDCESLVGAVAQFRPELVVLDISMPAMGGFAAAEQIHESWPDTKIIFVTQHSERAYLDRALLLGASAYVLKRALVADLLPAIREARRVESSSPLGLRAKRESRLPHSANYPALLRAYS